MCLKHQDNQCRRQAGGSWQAQLSFGADFVGVLASFYDSIFTHINIARDVHRSRTRPLETRPSKPAARPLLTSGTFEEVDEHGQAPSRPHHVPQAAWHSHRPSLREM